MAYIRSRMTADLKRLAATKSPPSAQPFISAMLTWATSLPTSVLHAPLDSRLGLLLGRPLHQDLAAFPERLNVLIPSKDQARVQKTLENLFDVFMTYARTAWNLNWTLLSLDDATLARLETEDITPLTIERLCRPEYKRAAKIKIAWQPYIFAGVPCTPNPHCTPRNRSVEPVSSSSR